MSKFKTNLLIHGDNIEAIKIILNKHIHGIKIAYIDPPYCSNTKNEHYSDCFDEDNYEIYIKSLIKEILKVLDEDGFIIYQIDSIHSFDAKKWLDSIIGKNNFRGQIIVLKNDNKLYKECNKKLISGYDCILLYSKNKDIDLPALIEEMPEEINGEWTNFYTTTTNTENQYPLFDKNIKIGSWRKSKNWAYNAIENYNKLLLFMNENDISLIDIEYGIRCFRRKNNLKTEDLQFIRKEKNKIEYYIPPSRFKHVTDLWSDINIRGNKTDFEHEVNEQLLKRIIGWLTKENDIVLDPFLGSGTSIVVASKMNRKWIGIEKEEYCTTLILDRVKNVEQEIKIYDL